MDAPEITVTAEPARIPEVVRAAMLHSLGQAEGEVWMFTLTCPHGQTLVPGVFKMLEPTRPENVAMTYEERHRIAVEELCESIKAQHLKGAPCPCSHPHWMRHGPLLASAIEGQPATVGIHDPEPNRN